MSLDAEAVKNLQNLDVLGPHGARYRLLVAAEQLRSQALHDVLGDIVAVEIKVFERY